MKVIQKRYTYFAISAAFFLISLFLILVPKLNLGIDMTGGTQGEYSYENVIDLEQARLEIEEEASKVSFEEKNVINNVSVYKISGEDKISVVIGFDNSIDEKELEIIKNTFRLKLSSILEAIDSTVIENQYINIGKSFGDYIKNTALLTLTIAIVAIALYVAWAFSGVVAGINVLSFSGITILTLFHDVIIASGMYILVSMFFSEFKIDTFFITALLTILGYSINDTIVIFDRIRANLKNIGKHKMSLEETVDFSINETIRRSIYTSLTLLFVLVTIFFFGPETIKGFTLVMIFGTMVGTYSSIFLASPLLYELNKNKKISHLSKKTTSTEDKIVV